MKSTMLIILCVVQVESSNWKQRMQKYGALLNCSGYFITSEVLFKNFVIPLEKIRDTSMNGYAHRLHFYILAKNSAKFVLAKKKYIDSADPYAINFIEDDTYRFVISDQTHINKQEGESPLTSLITPNAIRDNEPNEIIVGIFSDGKVILIVNQSIIMEAHIKHLASATTFGFASTKEKQEQELFYNCDIGSN